MTMLVFIKLNDRRTNRAKTMRALTSCENNKPEIKLPTPTYVPSASPIVFVHIQAEHLKGGQLFGTSCGE